MDRPEKHHHTFVPGRTVNVCTVEDMTAYCDWAEDEITSLRETLESIKVDILVRTDYPLDTLRKVIWDYADKALKGGG